MPEGGQDEQTREKAHDRSDYRRGDLDLMRLYVLTGVNGRGYGKGEEEEGHTYSSVTAGKEQLP